MLQFFGPPADAAHWIDGGVVARLGADVPVSRFPALPHAMLTMRVARAPARPAMAGTLCGPKISVFITSENPRMALSGVRSS